MTFPVVVKHRRSEARIYGKSKRYPYYRLAYYSDGKRQTQSFSKFGDAKEAAEKKVRDLNRGSHTLSLSSRESLDAMAAFDQLRELYRSTAHRVSFIKAVTEYSAAIKKLGDRPLSEAVDG